MALLGSLVATPIARAAGWRFGWLDHPDGVRKLHHAPTPRTGGLALAAAWTAAAVAVGLPATWWVPALLVFGLGLADDHLDLRPRTKLAFELILGAGLAWTPLALDVVSVPGLGVVTLGVAAVPLTALWFAGVVNALNLIDGLDGLTAGVALVAAAVLGGLLAGSGGALACAALAGALGGFLPWNVHRARVFLGDAGALFVGAVLACASLAAAHAHPVTVPLLALAVPLLDTVATIVRRAVAGQPLLRADREHVHHRLLTRGWSHGNAVLLLWLGGVLGAAAAVVAATDPALGVAATIATAAAGAWLVAHVGYVGAAAEQANLRV